MRDESTLSFVTRKEFGNRGVFEISRDNILAKVKGKYLREMLRNACLLSKEESD
jgi:hypothetical protein